MKEVRLRILEAYSNYQIPPNVIRHQFDVAAVGLFVAHHWEPEGLDLELLTRCLLLHDMGNIIKFRRPFMGELENEAKHWEQVQADFVATYGNDVHQATLAIIMELNLLPVAKLLDEMHDVWSNPEKIVTDEARIAEYADCCVTPTGITIFENRITDLKTRYGYTDASLPITAARQNAKYVANHVKFDLDEIAVRDFKAQIEKLQAFNL